jgi:hypothetical protein
MYNLIARKTNKQGLTGVGDGGADELAGDAAAEELGDIVEHGGADAGDVEVEDALAHEHQGALEPGTLVPGQVADDVSKHLGSRSIGSASSADLAVASELMWVVLCESSQDGLFIDGWA